MIELILVLAVGSMITLLSFQGMKRQTESNQAQVVGQQMRTIGQATNTYIANRYTPISQLANAAGTTSDPGPRTCAGATCTITVQTLVNEGLLPPTYKNLNNYGAGYLITLNVSGSSPNWNVTGVVTTDRPWTTGPVVRYDLLGQAMASAGADSGMSRTSASQIDGYGGVWTAPITNGPSLGLLGFQVGTGTSLYSVYLRRDGTLPMTGDLNMSDGTNHNINNANNIAGTGRFTSNQDYTNYVNLSGNLDMSGTATVGGNAAIRGAATVGGTIMAGGNIATNGFSPADFPAGFAGGVRTWDMYAGGTIGVGAGTAGAVNSAFAVSMNNAGNLLANGSAVIGQDATVGHNITVANHISTNGFNPDDYPAGWGGGIRTWDIAAGGTVGAGYGSGTPSGNSWQQQFAAGISQAGNGYMWSNGNADIGGTVSANYVTPKGWASVGSGCSPNGTIGSDGTQPLFCKNGLWAAAVAGQNHYTSIDIGNGGVFGVPSGTSRVDGYVQVTWTGSNAGVAQFIVRDTAGNIQNYYYGGLYGWNDGGSGSQWWFPVSIPTVANTASIQMVQINGSNSMTWHVFSYAQ